MRRYELIGEICWFAGYRRKLPGRLHFTKEELKVVFEFLKKHFDKPGSTKSKAKRRKDGGEN